MAHARADAKLFASRVPERQIPLPRTSLVDGDDCRHFRRTRIGFSTDVDRLEESQRPDALLTMFESSPPEEIARSVSKPAADDGVIHAAVAGDLDGTKEAAGARFGSHDQTRAILTDRLARNLHLRERITVVLERLDRRRCLRPARSSSVSATPGLIGSSSRSSSNSSAGRTSNPSSRTSSTITDEVVSSFGGA